LSSVLPANNHSDRTILVSGFAALAFTHLFALTPVAGWHLDEAWAGNFAHRIAFEKGFWPFQAMSPYTAAWSHYLAAIAFRLFGTSVLVYRATGILEVLIGIGLLTAALAAYGEKRAAAFLPWIIAFFPTLVMNHRWVIEMNTFFALCVGLIAYGMSKKKDSLIYAGALWGITSHILFLAPCLALLYWCWSNGRLSRQQKAGIAILSAVLAIFFLRIFLKTVSDDHKKAIVLIFLSVFTVFGVFIPFPSEKFKKYFLFIPVVFAAPLMFPFLLLVGRAFLFGQTSNSITHRNFFYSHRAFVLLLQKEIFPRDLMATVLPDPDLTHGCQTRAKIL
jgi:hypothetical protein